MRTLVNIAATAMMTLLAAPSLGVAGSKNDWHVEKAIECASFLRPLWDEFQSFKDDVAFQAGGLSAFPDYHDWQRRVLALDDIMTDPKASMRVRLANRPCGRWEATRIPGHPGLLNTSPRPQDLVQAAQLYRRDSHSHLQAQLIPGIEAFFKWAEALKKD